MLQLYAKNTDEQRKLKKKTSIGLLINLQTFHYYYITSAMTEKSQKDNVQIKCGADCHVKHSKSFKG